MGLRSSILAGSAVVELSTKSAKLKKGLDEAQARMERFASNAKKTGLSLLSSGAVMAAPLALATRTFAGFDDQMRMVKAVSGSTAEQFLALTNEAKLLGRTTSFTAKEVSGAMTEMARSGFGADQILAATGSVLNLSRATGTELARSTEIGAGVLRGFNKDVDEMGRVVDVMTATVNNSSQTLEDYGEAMKPLAPIASEAGESIEDVSAAVGILANNSIKGSLAGNSLARAYKNLSDSTKRKELEKMGVAVIDGNGNLRKMADIINDLATATKGMGTGDRLSIFETLFGRGQAAALKLASSGAAFDDLVKTIQNSTGIAARIAEEMDSGIGGSFRRFMSAAEGVGIAVGEAIEIPVSKATNALSGMLAIVTDLVNKNRTAIRVFAGIAATLLVVGGTLVAVGVGAQVLAFVVGGLAASIGFLGTAVGVAGAALAFLLSPIGLISVAVVGLAGLLVSKFDAIGAAALFVSERFGVVFGAFSHMLDGISTAIQDGNIELATDILMTNLQIAWLKGTNSIAETWYGFENMILKSLNSIAKSALSAWATIGMKYKEMTGTLTLGDIADYARRMQDIESGSEAGKALIDEITKSKLSSLSENLKSLEKRLADMNKENGTEPGAFTSGWLGDLMRQYGIGGGGGGGGSSVGGSFNARDLSNLRGQDKNQKMIEQNTAATVKATNRVVKAIEKGIPGGILIT